MIWSVSPALITAPSLQQSSLIPIMKVDWHGFRSFPGHTRECGSIPSHLTAKTCPLVEPRNLISLAAVTARNIKTGRVLADHVLPVSGSLVQIRRDMARFIEIYGEKWGTGSAVAQKKWRGQGRDREREEREGWGWERRKKGGGVRKRGSERREDSGVQFTPRE